MAKQTRQEWISNKISLLKKEGKPQKQAIAIAYEMWRDKKGKNKKK